MERQSIDEIVDQIAIVSGEKAGRKWSALMITYSNGFESMFFPKDAAQVPMAELLLEKLLSGKPQKTPVGS